MNMISLRLKRCRPGKRIQLQQSIKTTRYRHLRVLSLVFTRWIWHSLLPGTSFKFLCILFWSYDDSSVNQTRPQPRSLGGSEAAGLFLTCFLFSPPNAASKEVNWEGNGFYCDFRKTPEGNHDKKKKHNTEGMFNGFKGIQFVWATSSKVNTITSNSHIE